MLCQNTRLQEAKGATSRGTREDATGRGGTSGAPDGKSSEALSMLLSSLRPALTGKEGQWGWKPVNLGFLHEFCLLCPLPRTSLKDVTSEVSLSVKHRQLYLPPWALNGISGGNIRDPGLPVHSLNHVRLFETPWTVARQPPLSMGLLQAIILEWVAMPSSRGAPPGDLPYPGIEPRSPALQAHSLPFEPTREARPTA